MLKEFYKDITAVFSKLKQKVNIHGIRYQYCLSIVCHRLQSEVQLPIQIKVRGEPGVNLAVKYCRCNSSRFQVWTPESTLVKMRSGQTLDQRRGPHFLRSPGKKGDIWSFERLCKSLMPFCQTSFQEYSGRIHLCPRTRLSSATVLHDYGCT